jgi:hypothetical protein
MNLQAEAYPASAFFMASLTGSNQATKPIVNEGKTSRKLWQKSSLI